MMSDQYLNSTVPKQRTYYFYYQSSLSTNKLQQKLKPKLFAYQIYSKKNQIPIIVDCVYKSYSITMNLRKSGVENYYDRIHVLMNGKHDIFIVQCMIEEAFE